MLRFENIWDVVIAKDGQEAYDKVKENMKNGQYFDLIFMDIQMPNLDGLQSTRLIRQMGYSAPIVALTAFAEESNVKDCYDSGMNHFLRYCHRPHPTHPLPPPFSPLRPSRPKNFPALRICSKPIKRPALKQVLQKFATIPEETDTSSVTGTSSTPDPETSTATTSEQTTPLPNGSNPP
jgi:osomolarity two-component system sensor histidine kinase SLN1